MRIVPLLLVSLVAVSVFSSPADADWTRFRGTGAMGISLETKLPATWDKEKNVKWKTKLPGLGSSSPIIHGDRVFVTCYSGYGESRTQQSSLDKLVRHLVCIDRKTGKTIWSRKVAAEKPEDSYAGFISEHGYASSTPVADDERVYAFFGKSGVVAFDHQGKQLWKVNVGKESSNRRWGSAASLILYKGTVIVNASEESQSILALDKKTGKQVWKVEASTLDLVYSTPTLVTVDNGKTDLVLAVPGEVWGLNPDTGKLNWYCTMNLTGNITPTIIAKDGVMYVFGGRSSGSVAIRAGGKGDVTKTHKVWTGRGKSYVATPLLYEDRLYWVDDRGQAQCIDAKTGEEVYRERLTGVRSGGRTFYSSMVLAGDKLYAVSRRSGVFVFPAGPKFKQLARNVLLESDESDFNATPAISDGQIFIRSNSYLYCIGQ